MLMLFSSRTELKVMVARSPINVSGDLDEKTNFSRNSRRFTKRIRCFCASAFIRR
jgi:hypothetical protein